ncbi:BnaC09g28860D [Brassica napus]|uniref:BnaC09g28860D protein n=1 Tax=Brassica napus TaxID=3708 RepID=A0A078IHG1_BRANA|nr:BnaC09g28860D [Brassica napus]
MKAMNSDRHVYVAWPWGIEAMRLSLHLAISHGDQRGHKNWVLSIAWSPDGKHLVSGSKSGELCCWNPKKGELDGNPLTGQKKWIPGISWEPSPPYGHTLAVTCVKWGGDGIIYTGSQDCTIKMWETTQGRLILLYCVYFMFCFFCLLYGHGHWVNSPALSTENEERYNQAKGDSPERLVSGSDDFTMFLWEPSVSKQSKKRLTGHQQLVNHVYFSPDGKWVASASFDRSVRLWNGVTGQFVTAFRRHVGPVYQVSWSADSRLLLSGSKDSTLKIWEIRTKTLKQDLPGHADEFFAVDWSPDGEKVVSGGKERILKLWKG